MKKQYVQPAFEALYVSNEDVLTASPVEMGVLTPKNWNDLSDI